jgi:cytochrome c biogenesis protein CcdA
MFHALDLAGAFLSGVGALWSECALVLAPLYWALLAGTFSLDWDAPDGRLAEGLFRRLFRVGCLAAGFMAVFLALGLPLSHRWGHAAYVLRPELRILGALAAWRLGLGMWGPRGGRLGFLFQPPRRWASLAAAGVLGAGAAAAFSPCSGPMGVFVLLYTSVDAGWNWAGALLAARTLGLAPTFLVVWSFFELTNLFVWSKPRGQARLRRLAGLVLIFYGIVFAVNKLNVFYGGP